ncbi:hypothetical protein FRX31_010961 [Thalictrum thalictroides]|uniref:Uncharacterized protein n=1 Tax=Thalictrum thalictroides TaxID=46969 RepID=A0A7J6WTV7_THATH|nr:hypothetical protein FRX31_010961 [Thalictrum thalictroides]
MVIHAIKHDQLHAELHAFLPVMKEAVSQDVMFLIIRSDSLEAIDMVTKLWENRSLLSVSQKQRDNFCSILSEIVNEMPKIWTIVCVFIPGKENHLANTISHLPNEIECLKIVIATRKLKRAEPLYSYSSRSGRLIRPLVDSFLKQK